MCPFSANRPTDRSPIRSIDPLKCVSWRHTEKTLLFWFIDKSWNQLNHEWIKIIENWKKNNDRKSIKKKKKTKIKRWRTMKWHKKFVFFHFLFIVVHGNREMFGFMETEKNKKKQRCKIKVKTYLLFFVWFVDHNSIIIVDWSAQLKLNKLLSEKNPKITIIIGKPTIWYLITIEVFIW